MLTACMSQCDQLKPLCRDHFDHFSSFVCFYPTQVTKLPESYNNSIFNLFFYYLVMTLGAKPGKNWIAFTISTNKLTIDKSIHHIDQNQINFYDKGYQLYNVIRFALKLVEQSGNFTRIEDLLQLEYALVKLKFV